VRVDADGTGADARTILCTVLSSALQNASGEAIDRIVSVLGDAIEILVLEAHRAENRSEDFLAHCETFLKLPAASLGEQPSDLSRIGGTPLCRRRDARQWQPRRSDGSIRVGGTGLAIAIGRCDAIPSVMGPRLIPMSGRLSIGKRVLPKLIRR